MSGSWDSQAIVIELGHRLAQGHADKACPPERHHVGCAAELGEAATQKEGKNGCALAQPAPPATHGMTAETGHAVQRRGQAEEQQQENPLLQRPCVPPPGADAQR